MDNDAIERVISQPHKDRGGQDCCWGGRLSKTVCSSLLRAWHSVSCPQATSFFLPVTGGSLSMPSLSLISSPSGCHNNRLVPHTHFSITDPLLPLLRYNISRHFGRGGRCLSRFAYLPHGDFLHRHIVTSTTSPHELSPLAYRALVLRWTLVPNKIRTYPSPLLCNC